MRSIKLKLLIVLFALGICTGQSALAQPLCKDCEELRLADADTVSALCPDCSQITTQDQVYKGLWRKRFWFLNARLRLVWTKTYITVPTGFWGGWWWWHHQGHWFDPWYGPVGWWKRYCHHYPYPDYWAYWPYYTYYQPWWHNWRWCGWPWFWGFKDCLTYRYRSWRPRIIYWWSYYWESPGQGNCLELVTMSDEKNPAGGRILPVDPGVSNHLDVQRHQYSVNGGKVEGEFTPLKFIKTAGLEDYYRTIPGVTESDVQAFMGSDIVKELMKNDPSGEGMVGVQHAQWQHPRPPLDLFPIEMVERNIGEGSTATYAVRLSLPPEKRETVVVNVVSSEPEDLQIMGANPDGLLQLHFDATNWDLPQYVHVMAVKDSLREGQETVMLAHFLESDPENGFALPVYVQDTDPGQ